MQLLAGPGRAVTGAMQALLLHVITGLLCCAVSSPVVQAGEWIVETHSLIVRSPASIAGTEDAAIGDVSSSHSQLPEPSFLMPLTF